jgi:hypothetical protein
MNKLYKILGAIVSLLGSFILVAQSKVEMADGFRADGKIYVVIAVLVTILAGLFYTLVRIDKRITKLEKEVEER